MRTFYICVIIFMVTPQFLQAQEVYELFERSHKEAVLPDTWGPMDGKTPLNFVETSWLEKTIVIGGNISSKIAGISRPCPQVKAGEVATYYCEFSLLDEELFHYLGYSSLPLEGVRSSGTLSMWLLLRKSSTGEGVDIFVPTGQKDAKRIYSSLRPDASVTYCLWLVMDSKNSCFDVYLKSQRGKATEDDLLARKVPFHKGLKGPVQSFAVMCKKCAEPKNGSLELKNWAYGKGVQLGGINTALAGGPESSQK
ncbi:hypothetical protein JIN82_04310 [Persicirhabdus sediminis]|uniref:Uncharacterized protein n=1 Tax=Persicirhabdus sediminis TaxID=454144 RepID=A0A8J7MC37_9BACT|nr:hypothetical protein [Persicirhabdus sediminis]